MAALTRTKCEECAYFVSTNANPSEGVCKRYPPKYVTEEKQTVWPTVQKSTDYCGEIVLATRT